MRAALVLSLLLTAALPALAQQPEPEADATTAETAAPDPDAIRRSRFSERPSDTAYGAFQRGYYITALNLATPLAIGGDAAAQTLIGEIYSRGLGVRRDLAIAIEWYEKAAEQKVPEALFQLAMLLYDGGEQFGDRPRALTLIGEAAEAGHGLAQFNLAQMLVAGSRPQDVTRAVAWYERAAKAGLADAQYAMAEIHRQGFAGRHADAAEARRWLALAAAQNHDTAQIELGTMLVEGEGGARDEKAGFSWLMRAAVAGNPAAQTRVAKLYRAGIGVEPDRVTACAWYLRARRAGLTDPVMEDQLDGLTDEEMAEARKRAATLG